jgi:hypothetical protein
MVSDVALAPNTSRLPLRDGTLRPLHREWPC